MTTFQHPTSGDVNTTDDPIVGAFLESRGFLPLISADQAAELKGSDLDDALRAAELPLTGSADEKRARLAQYLTEEHDDVEVQEPVELDPIDPTQNQ